MEQILAYYTEESILKEAHGIWGNKGGLFKSDWDRGRVGEGWVLKNEIGVNRGRKVLRQNNMSKPIGLYLIRYMCMYM